MNDHAVESAVCAGCFNTVERAYTTAGEAGTLWCDGCVEEAATKDPLLALELAMRASPDFGKRRPAFRTETILGSTAFGLLTLPSAVAVAAPDSPLGYEFLTIDDPTPKRTGVKPRFTNKRARRKASR
jgi:hypothetical protein